MISAASLGPRESRFRTILEPFRVKSVERIRLPTTDERRTLLACPTAPPF